MSLKPARLLAVAAAAATLALAGCSADSTPSSDETAAADGAFPVTLTDALGEATIEAKPERIVTIGWAAQDVVAALGTVPVGITDFTWGTVDKYLPWFVDTVDELGGELPEIVGYTDDEIDFDQVLALEPDVILAPHSGITENEYARLSDIAPTIAYTGAPWTSDWKELTLTVGKVMGQEEDAQKLIDSTDSAIRAQADLHPEFQGVTFTYGWYMSDGATALDLYFPQDPRVQVIEQLGFVPSPQVVELGKASPDKFYGSVSLEELSTVESQFHLGWIDQPGDIERTVGNPLVAAWGPVKNDSYYFMDDQALAWASSAPTVLSIPWQLDKIVPELASHLNVAP